MQTAESTDPKEPNDAKPEQVEKEEATTSGIATTVISTD